jgi:hypothetical protein
MSLGRVLSLVLVTLFVTTKTAAAAVTAWTDVDVRVYDAAGLDAKTRQAALDLANAALAAASVEIAWQICGVALPHPLRCDTRLTQAELAIRIVRTAAVPRGESGLRLGDAFIDSQSGRGVLATIYFDRVLLLSERTGRPLAMLLGRAIAHELGHLLMASNTHGPIGLMRAFWSQDEVRGGHASDWTFSPRDAHAIEVGAKNISARGAWGTN